MAAERTLIIGCDIDDTLVPINDRPQEEREAGYAALEEFCTALEQDSRGTDELHFGSVTGRTWESHQEYEGQHAVFARAVTLMNFAVTAVGTAIHYRNGLAGFVADADWPPATSWSSDDIKNTLQGRSELTLQPEIAQTTHKLSYEVRGVSDAHHTAYTNDLQSCLAEAGLRSKILFSGGAFLDFVPVDKGDAIMRVATRHATSGADDDTTRRPFTVAAGDSMNDAALLRAADLAIIPRNAHNSLKQWAAATIPRTSYLARAAFAAGVLEGLYAHDLLVA